MRRKVDSRTVWSLTAIRNGKQENADEIDNAQFYYGRWQSEVAGSRPKRLPSGLIGIIGDYGMEQTAMESGFLQVAFGAVGMEQVVMGQGKAGIQIERLEIFPNSSVKITFLEIGTPEIGPHCGLTGI